MWKAGVTWHARPIGEYTLPATQGLPDNSAISTLIPQKAEEKALHGRAKAGTPHAGKGKKRRARNAARAPGPSEILLSWRRSHEPSHQPMTFSSLLVIVLFG